MLHEPAAARMGLRNLDPRGPAPALAGVQATGRLDAVLFDLTVRQTYRNTSGQVLEVVYTFPLPADAVLLGFASELNGQRLHGAVVARPEAEKRYETALAEGDAPVMLEALGDGLHTANIGNLQPGDELVLEVRFAQWLAFEQGRLRLAIPTTIAPRYGDAERAGGLQPQQAPVFSWEADYPLALSLTLGPALAGAAVECPTHRLVPTGPAAAAPRERATAPGGAAAEACFALAPGAWLDRDVVVIVTPCEPRPSLLVRAADAFDAAAPVVLMAALQPTPLPPRERIALKLLVDCSGSMQGDSIDSARAALRGAVAGLDTGDRVSLSRFGGTVEHVLGLAELTPATLRRAQRHIDAMQADLGGTEMEAALRAVFELGGTGVVADAATDAVADAAAHDARDVLLITDGEIWSAEATVQAARRSGHRVFAIGVGSAPAEGVLRALAEATGGACEFATPGEALEAAARRMLQRIRQPLQQQWRVDWGREPVWQVGPGASVFSGDTVVALAGFAAGAAPAGPVRLLCHGPAGTAHERARTEAEAPVPGDTVARMGAARRLRGLGSAATRVLELALRYQLMCAQTNCVLVHERAAADKARQPAELHRVPSMPAAGWGGTGYERTMIMAAGASPRLGSAAPFLACSADSMQIDGLAPVRGARDIRFSVDPFAGLPLSDSASDPADGARYLIDPSFNEPPEEPSTPAVLELARSVGVHLGSGGELPDLAEACAAWLVHDELRPALAEAALLGLTRDEACLALAIWVSEQPGGLGDAARTQALQEALRPHRAAIEAGRLARACEIFERHLGVPSAAAAGGAGARAQRLRRALRRA